MDCFRFRLFDEDAGWMVLFLWRSINVYKAVVLTTLLYGAESYGSPIVAICTSSSVAVTISAAYVLSQISIGVISAPTLRSLKWLRLPASRPCSSKHSFAGQDMSPGWKTIAYQRSYYNIYGELSTGHRDKGTLQKIYKVNRMNWRRTCTVYQATTSFKATRIDRRSGPVERF